MAFSQFYRFCLLPVLLAGSILSCTSRQPAAEEKPAPAASQAPAVTAQSDLPYLPLTRLDGTQMSAREIPGKTVLVLFQPDCDHCQREAVAIREHLDSFSGYSLYFISNVPAPEIAAFAEEYQLADKPNIYFATTTLEAILQTFGPIDTPSVYIYSDTGRLKKSFIGETAIGNILGYL